MFGGLYSPSAVLAVLVWTRDNSGTTWGQLTMRGSVVSALIWPQLRVIGTQLHLRPARHKLPTPTGASV